MKSNLQKVSDFVILYCQNMGVTINPLKLQKLLYYIQCWHIVKFEKDILFEELPEAWVNGPVYRQIYDKYKSSFFKNSNFPTSLQEEALSSEVEKHYEELNFSDDQKNLILTILNFYGKLSDERLVFMTHGELPWNEARKGLSPLERSENKISPDVIYNYYSERLANR